MNLKGTTKLLVSVISLALACIIFASAQSSFGQTDQAPTTPRPVDPSPDRNKNPDKPEQSTSDGAFKPVRNKADKVRDRTTTEEMIVIDAATRQKDREREKMQHDHTFDSSIMDVGVNSIPRAKSSGPARAIPAASPNPSSPNARPNVTPAPLSVSNPGAGASLSLEVVPIPKASQPSPTPTPSATTSPHN